MAIIIANENGDWWGFVPSDENPKQTTLSVLDTDTITDPDTLAEIAEWAGVDLEIDSKGDYIIPPNIDELINEGIFDSEKLHNLAYDFGKEIEVKF